MSHTKSVGLALVALSFVLSSWLVFAKINNATNALGGWATDHLSHVGESVLFWYRGFAVFKEPAAAMSEFIDPSRRERIHKETGIRASEIIVLPEDSKKTPLDVNWNYLPRPYPLGAFLYHAPEAIALKAGDQPALMLAKFTLFKYLLLTHILLIIIVGNLFSKFITLSWPRTFKDGAKCFLVGVSVYLIWSQLLYWSLLGFYDSLSILFMVCAILAYQKEKEALALVLYCLAFFTHFRSLWFAAFFIFAFIAFVKKHFIRKKPLSGRLLILLSVAACLALSSLMCFFLVFPSLNDWPLNNALSIRNFRADTYLQWGSIAVASLCLGVCGAFRLIFLLILLLNILVFLFSTPQLYWWHTLYLIPLFAVPVGKNKTLQLMVVLVFYLSICAGFFGFNPLATSFLGEMFYTLIG